MILIHLFISEHRALSNLNVPLSSEFQCTVDKFFYVTIQRRYRPFLDFYEGYKFQAIIGQNGSGKSSIIDAMNVFEGDSDSSVLAIFYDTEESRYKICLYNIAPDSITVASMDCGFDFVEDAVGFFKEHSVDVVHINAMQESRVASVTPTRRKKGSYVRRLTVFEAMQSQNARRDYFNRYLRYFRQCLFGEYRENIRYMFSLSPSSVGRFEGALARYRQKVDSKLLGQWLKEFRQRALHLEFPSLSKVEWAAVGMNVPSILVVLAKHLSNDDDADFTALKMLENYALFDYENSGAHPGDLIAKALERYFFTISEVAPSSKAAKARALSHAPGYEEAARAKLSKTITRLEEFASALYFANPDDTRLDFSGVIIEDYDVVEQLTEIASRLPPNVAGNIRWGWRGASTGELARAHVFSELFNYLLGRKDATSSIVFIDEADLYLHPEWQRRFMSDILALIRHAGTDPSPSNLQVIISTHSPIIVSDFLSDDIISLNVNEDVGLLVGKSSGFGSSIVDIYMNDMHLSSTFGEHAAGKLNALVVAAKRHALSEADRMLIDEISSNTTRSFLLSYDKNQ